jgi:hypothetical protein
MSDKKYTAKQIRAAREIVDQEEAVRAERMHREPTSRITKMWRKDRRRFIGTTSAIVAFALLAAPFDIAIGWQGIHFDSPVVGEFPTDAIGDKWEDFTGVFTTSSELYYGGNEWDMPRPNAMLLEVIVAALLALVAAFSLLLRAESVVVKARRN